MNNYLDMDEDNPYRLHGSANPNVTGHRPLVNHNYIAPPENEEPAAEDAAKAFTAVPVAELPSVAAHAAELAAKKEDRDEAKAQNNEKAANSFLVHLKYLLEDFIYAYDINNNLTGQERMRLIGAGVHNFGFIEKAYDIARENPQFVPRDFSIQMFGYNLQDLEDARQLFWVLQAFLNAANELMLTSADIAFRDALRVYNSLREASRAKRPGANVLYRALLQYFRRRRPRPGEAEPTDKELERDFMKLIHGHADGEITIVNEQPHFSGGVRKVVDNVHTGHADVKENAQAEVKE
jgi:hypothetical protein